MALNARLSHRSLFFFFIRSSPTHEATNFVYMHNSLWAIKYYYLYAFSSTLCHMSAARSVKKIEGKFGGILKGNLLLTYQLQVVSSLAFHLPTYMPVLNRL